MAGSDWADIATDLVLILAERVVGVAAFIRFSAVCKSWNSIASTTKCSNPVPWLMLAEKEGSGLRDFYDHSTGEVYELPLPQAQGVMTVGSSHGWLITTTASEGGRFHLLNPLNGTQIALPFTSSFPSVFLRNYLGPKGIRDRFLVRAVCSPMDPSGDYIVAATHMMDNDWFLSYCKSTDKEWTTIELKSAKSVSFVGDVLFMVTSGGDLYRIKIRFDTCTSSVAKITLVPQSDGRYYPREHQCYIVECEGAIFVVGKIYTFTNPILTKYFDVFRLDMVGKELVRVTDIGDYAFFLGRSFSLALRITPCMKKFKRNCIYFTDDRNEQSDSRRMKCGCNMGVYDIEDGSITQHYPHRVTNSFPSMPVWVTVDPFPLLAV